ncbi:oligosaccharide flippase family protein [Vibrio fortis]|uniref:oligosaccharide flippase family protein n=1 Tax=Vibrio fortis TaxID=212667 RepID=UPI002F3F1DCA
MNNKKTLLSLFVNVGSNVLSQVLAVAFIPILARMYKPEDFAMATLFLGVASCFVSISSLRLSVTIPLSANEKDRGIGLVTSTLIVLLLSTAFFIFNEMFSLLEVLEIGSYSYILFLFVILLSINNILINVIISNGSYKVIGGSKVLNSITLNLTRLILAYTTLSNGMLYSLVVSEIFVFLLLYCYSKKTIKSYLSEYRFCLGECVEYIKKYIDYPKFQVISQFILISSQYAPIFMLSNSFSTLQVGLFVMANNLVSLPVNSVGLALSQIYLGEYRKKENQKNIFKHSGYIVGFFMMASVPFIFLMSIWGDSIVGFLLGEQWIDTAPLISMLIFLGSAKLCMAVISQSLNIFNGQRLQLFINFLFFMLSYSSLYICIMLKWDFYTTVLLYTISGSFALFVGIYLTMRNIMVKSKYENSIFG